MKEKGKVTLDYTAGLMVMNGVTEVRSSNVHNVTLRGKQQGLEHHLITCSYSILCHVDTVI